MTTGVAQLLRSAVVLAAPAFPGCAGPEVLSTVEVFVDLPANGSGRTIALLPANDKGSAPLSSKPIQHVYPSSQLIRKTRPFSSQGRGPVSNRHHRKSLVLKSAGK